MAENFEARVIGFLDTSKIEDSLKNLKNVKLIFDNVDTSNLTSKIQSELQKQKFSIQVANVSVGNSAQSGIKQLNQDIRSSLQSIDLVNGGLGNMRKMLQGAGFNKNAINSITQEFSNMNIEVTKIRSEMLSNGNIKMNISGIQEIGDGVQRAVTILREYDKETGNITNKSKTFVQSFATAGNSASQMETQLKKVESAIATTSKANILSNNIQTWMNNNKKAAQQYGDVLVGLQSRLENVQSTTELKNIQRDFNEIKAKAKAAGLASSGFGQQLKQAVLQSAGLASVYQVVQKVVQITKDGVQTVIELDDALVDLKKTTTMSAQELTNFYYDANESAKKYGVTTQEIIQSAADWSRLGFSDKESATKMAELSSQFAMISPGMDVETATTGLVSIMKAYGMAVDDVLDGVMSKINIVGNSFATTNEDILKGLQRSSAALAMTGTGFEQNVALFTAGQEIVQNAEMVGTALRTMSMRIRGYDEETEQLSDDLKTITGDLADLTKTASNNYQGISIFKDGTNEFKQLGDYMVEIADIWDELSSKRQNDLLEKMFGKRSATTGASILNNIDAYNNAIEVMGRSAGNADAEMKIVAESITYQLNELKETWVGIAQDVFQSDELKGFVNGLTDVSETIGNLLDSIGGIPVVFGAVVAALSAKKMQAGAEMFALNEYGLYNLVVTRNELAA